MKTAAVIGLGYVGLPLACLLSKKGFKTYGIDIDKNKIDLINDGISPIEDKKLKKDLKKCKIFATSDFKVLKKSDVIVICVPTPVDSDHKPNLKPLISAAKSAAGELKKGHLVIVESTIFPGTIEDIIKPILEHNGMKAGRDFYLAHCPERIDPGNKKWDVSNIPRVVGAISKKGLKKASKFYRTFLNVSVLELSTVKAAEAVKITENTFRDVNIAFVNELARSFDRLGIDAVEVINGAATKPFAFMPHYPGCGVGGHCIPVDPYYLIERAKQNGFNHNFLSLARDINKNMPEYTVQLLIDELNNIEKSLKNANIGVLGLAYKKDIDDIRESPAFDIIKKLKERKANLFIFDPYVKIKSNVSSFDELLKKSDYLVLVTDHNLFKNMNLMKLKRNGIKIVIDGKNCLDKNKIMKMGIRYKGIGR